MWTEHIQAPSKTKVRQHLHNWIQLRKFGVAPAILKTFCSGAVESTPTQNIASWFANSCAQDRKALQGVVLTAERRHHISYPANTGHRRQEMQDQSNQDRQGLVSPKQLMKSGKDLIKQGDGEGASVLWPDSLSRTCRYGF